MNSQTNSIATLVVKTLTGFGIFPLGGVLVTVTAENFSGRSVITAVFTDESGTTPEIRVNLAPSEGGIRPPDNRVTVTASKDGYLQTVLQGVSLYGGVTTVQTVNMAALPDRDGALLHPYDRELIVTTDDGSARTAETEEGKHE